MKIDFPKIVHEIDLGEYDESMKGQKVFVWVNPTSQMLIDLGDFYKQGKDNEEKFKEYLKLLAELLSQGKEQKATVKDLEALIKNSADTDPAFWIWFQNKIVIEINNFRIGLKKDLAPPAPS